MRRRFAAVVAAAAAPLGGLALSVSGGGGGAIGGGAAGGELEVTAVRFVDGPLTPLVLAALPKGIDFFAEDAQKMKELVDYDSPKSHQQHVEAWRLASTHGRKACVPRCDWACEKKECQQTCAPVCAPPQCRTLCERRAETCETRCGAPQCAVVCPQQECSQGDGRCGKCRTVCAPPVCTDQCGIQCQNVCEKPKCSWNCTVGSCPEPDCKVKCTGVTKCEGDYRPVNPTVPPQYPGDRDLVGKVEGYASLDPSVLSQPVTPPPPWERKEAKPEAPKKTDPRSSVGPVHALKMRWRAANKDWRIKRQAQPVQHAVPKDTKSLSKALGFGA